MTTVEIIILAVALAMDAFSVSASAGPRCCPRFGALRLAASFGGFQALMPLLGALAGSLLYVHVREFDHWVAFGLLQLVGWRMIFEALRHWKDGASARQDNSFDPSRGLSLLVLSIAVLSPKRVRAQLISARRVRVVNSRVSTRPSASTPSADARYSTSARVKSYPNYLPGFTPVIMTL